MRNQGVNWDIEVPALARLASWGQLQGWGGFLIEVVRSVFHLLRTPARVWRVALLYLVLCAAVTAGFLVVITLYREPLRETVFAYVLPASWVDVGALVIDYTLAKQQMHVIVNAILGASLMLISLTLFPVKELVSIRAEQADALISDPISEFPLTKQAWQEVKLFLLFITAQGLIFWIGYHPNPWQRAIATIASYLLLFFTFAVDFIAPLFQRHQGHYSQILKLLVRHPIRSLSFGACFALPGVLAGNLLARTSLAGGDSWIVMLWISLAANVIAICCATISGTWLAARLYAPFRDTPRSRTITRVFAIGITGALFATNLYLFGAVLLSLHHKSQILKCEYDVDFASIGLDRPKLSSLVSGTPEIGVHFSVTITNPTSFDVHIEDNRIDVTHNSTLLGTAALPRLKIAAGETKTQRVEFSAQANLASLKNIRQMLSKKGWRITLYVQVAPGFELPISICWLQRCDEHRKTAPKRPFGQYPNGLCNFIRVVTVLFLTAYFLTAKVVWNFTSISSATPSPSVLPIFSSDRLILCSPVIRKVLSSFLTAVNLTGHETFSPWADTSTFAMYPSPSFFTSDILSTALANFPASR